MNRIAPGDSGTEEEQQTQTDMKTLEKISMKDLKQITGGGSVPGFCAAEYSLEECRAMKIIKW